MKFKRTPNLELGWINFIPFLNIVFLLVFFALISSALVIQPGIKIDVPAASALDLAKEDDVAIVTISKDNRIFLAEIWMPASELRREIKLKVNKNPKTLVIIKADSNVLHDKVVEVMNIIIEAGAKRISIAAKPK